MSASTTARSRSIQWPEKTPAQATESVLSGVHEHVAFLFGRESSGLTNLELERCQFLVRIPVEESFSSLNLASAVTIILYELRKRAMADLPFVASTADKLATAEEMRGFLEHMERFVKRVEFGKVQFQT